MARYRVTLQSEVVTRTPDSKSDTPKHFKEVDWVDQAKFEGDAKIVASALRAMADELDPQSLGLRPDHRKGVGEHGTTIT